MKMDIPKNTYVTHDEVAKYFEAPDGCMPNSYSADGDAHLTETGIRCWFQVLQNYAQSQQE